MSTATWGRVLAPVTGRYGGASSDLSLILDLVAREMARKHTAFYNIGFSEAKAFFRRKLARKWVRAIARGWATLLLDPLRDFFVVPSSAGRNSSFELHSQSMEERANHFGLLLPLPWPLGHVRLNSFLGVVSLLCFFSLPVSLLITALRGLGQNEIPVGKF